MDLAILMTLLVVGWPAIASYRIATGDRDMPPWDRWDVATTRREIAITVLVAVGVIAAITGTLVALGAWLFG